jgi:hypothetical protein
VSFAIAAEAAQENEANDRPLNPVRAVPHGLSLFFAGGFAMKNTQHNQDRPLHVVIIMDGNGITADGRTPVAYRARPGITPVSPHCAR